MRPFRRTAVSDPVVTTIVRFPTVAVVTAAVVVLWTKCVLQTEIVMLFVLPTGKVAGVVEATTEVPLGSNWSNAPRSAKIAICARVTSSFGQNIGGKTEHPPVTPY